MTVMTDNAAGPRLRAGLARAGRVLLSLWDAILQARMRAIEREIRHHRGFMDPESRQRDK